jgi:hypothetical protein
LYTDGYKFTYYWFVNFFWIAVYSSLCSFEHVCVRACVRGLWQLASPNTK